MVRSVAEPPHALPRAPLRDQGWREGDAVTTISDGDPALPALVRSATGGPVEPILDWFHFSHARTMSSRSCTACVPSGHRPSPRSAMRRSTWNDCDTCFGCSPALCVEARDRPERIKL